jgi:FkbM family methyltransferase
VFELVQKDDVVIDCGAYVGKITHYFADRGARVYALDPSPILHTELEKRFIEYPNVSVIRKGVYDKDCQLKFYYHTEFSKADAVHRIKYF